MSQYNLENKVVKLQSEIEQLKTSQILGGDNAIISKGYLEKTISVPVNLQSDPRVYFFDTGSGTGGLESHVCLFPKNNDPFALLSIEKFELWRGGKKLTNWGDFTQPNTRYYLGQRSEYGDCINFTMGRNDPEVWVQSDVWEITQVLGYYVIIEIVPGWDLTDNPATPFYYTIKVWFRTTGDANEYLLR